MPFAAIAQASFPVDSDKLAVDDSWTYLKKDPTNNQVTGTQTMTIAGRNGDNYSIDVQQTEGFSITGPAPEALSLDLGWIRTINGAKADAKWLSFPLAPGKTSKSNDLWQNAIKAWGHEDVDYTVVGVETITVPAGTFEVVKIEGKGWWNVDSMSVTGGVGRPTGNGADRIKVWYSPKAQAIVRIEWDTDVPAGRRRITNELTAFKISDAGLRSNRTSG